MEQQKKEWEEYKESLAQKHEQGLQRAQSLRLSKEQQCAMVCHKVFTIISNMFVTPFNLNTL